MQDDRDAEIAHLKSALAAAEQRESVAAERAVRAEIERDAALEQQTATAEVLRTIARAPTDVQPVLDALILRAMHLSASGGALLAIRDGHHMRFMADAGGASPGVSFRTGGGSQVGDRVLLTRDRPNGRAILDGRTIHIPDGSDPRLITEYPESTFPFAAARLHVPLLRGHESIGNLTLFRDRARPFSDRAIALLETFADQAVIAIENARLFEELEQRNAQLQESNRQVTEALEQQTATADVLRVIASSPTDLHTVLDTIVTSAGRLVDASTAAVWRVEGDVLRGAATYTSTETPTEVAIDFSSQVRPIDASSYVGQATRERQTLRVADLAESVLGRSPDTVAWQQRVGQHSLVATPLLHEDEVVAILVVTRSEVLPFSDEHVALLQTFADQAVIAIENARLFEELGRRNRELNEALEQQTATAEILRAIATTPTDVQHVLNTLASSALHLCGANQVVVYRLDGDVMRFAATGRQVPPSAFIDGQELGQGVPLSRDFVSGRAAIERRTIQVLDLLNDPDYPLGQRMAAGNGHRTTLGIPLLREGISIGALSMTHKQVRPFSDQQIALLETFAHQAVIALENARSSRRSGRPI